jgi:tRNA nucleotidyltransferase (CCA-adding enzyme)
VLDDLKRRDFTINSLLMNSNKEIIDYLDAKKDINDKLIRTIGNPDNRFIEDALRMLRVFSFVSKLGFDVDKDTYLSIKKNKDLLKNVSIERIRIEFDKLSKGLYRKKAWHLFYELKINELFPNMDKINDYDSTFRDILICNILENDEISDFWQLSKLTIRNLKKASNIVKEGVTDYNLFINGYIPSMYALEYLKMDKTKWDNLKIKSLKDLEINGNDLINIIGKTKRGECLNYLSKLVLEGKIENKYNILLEEAKKWNI